MARYAEATRHYHNLDHVADCLRLLDEQRDAAADAVEAAIWFHDAIYVCGAADNEQRSAALVLHRLTGLGMAAERAERVAALVRATDHRAPALSGDAALLCDIDLAVLGQPAARYDAYAAAILRETGLTPAAFAAPRHAFLEAMLRKPQLFHTERFRACYEAAARANMQRELERWAAERT